MTIPAGATQWVRLSGADQDIIERAFDTMGQMAAERGLVVDIAVYGESCLILAAPLRCGRRIPQARPRTGGGSSSRKPNRRARMPRDGRWWAYETMRTGLVPGPGDIEPSP